MAWTPTTGSQARKKEGLTLQNDLTVIELFLCTNHSYVQPGRGAPTNARCLYAVSTGACGRYFRYYSTTILPPRDRRHWLTPERSLYQEEIRMTGKFCQSRLGPNCALANRVHRESNSPTHKTHVKWSKTQNIARHIRRFERNVRV